MALLKDFLQFTQKRLHNNLQQLFVEAQNESPSENTLLQAMLYSVLNGGKRVRPMLVYGASIAVKGEAIKHNEDYIASEAEDCFANAIELMHGYSLVHDDLPAMDDDDLRRGQATCHIKFDEATAILAGDALQTLAFEQALKRCGLPYKAQLEALRYLAKASGMHGMVMGQAIDLASVNTRVDLEHLEYMHQLKTGALIETSVRLGAIAAEANGTQMQALSAYAAAIGLAFQVQDDILDVIGDTSVLGKAQGADISLNKPTYVSLLGLEGAKAKAQELKNQAFITLESFGEEAQLLRELASYIVERQT